VSTVIRRLGPGDEPAACAIASLFKSANLSPGRAAQFLGNPANCLVVAEADDTPVGFLLAYRLERLDHQAGQLFVYEIDVAPDYQRRGIGTRLMEYVRALVRDEHLMEAFVLTSRDNDAALALYRATGGRIEDEAGILFVYPGGAA
jgi:ribosomal protein S18 acetylase RimI-like enzyme